MKTNMSNEEIIKCLMSFDENDDEQFELPKPVKFLNPNEYKPNNGLPEDNITIYVWAVWVSNPLAPYFLDGHVNEGLIKTYGPDKTKEYVEQLFGGSENVTITKDKKPVMEKWDKSNTGLFVTYVNTEVNHDAVAKAMGLCGYDETKHTVTQDADGKIRRSDYYLPRYTENITGLVRSNKGVVYHITQVKNLTKIQKQGIVAKQKNLRFKYISKIHLMKPGVGWDETMNLLRQLDMFVNHNKQEGYNGEWCIMEIDINELPNDCKFYQDPSYVHGMFIFDVIPPKAIKRIKKIKL